MERSTTQGLPEDEIFVYEDALRKGRSVVILSPTMRNPRRCYAIC